MRSKILTDVRKVGVTWCLGIAGLVLLGGTTFLLIDDIDDGLSEGAALYWVVAAAAIWFAVTGWLMRGTSNNRRSDG